MSRPLLSLFALDRGALSAVETELHDILSRDDRSALITLLGLGSSFSEQVRAAARAVDLFLVPESEAVGLYASLRRVAKKRSLSHLWTSEAPALEGRLREYDRIREDPALALRVDALLGSRHLPWFLLRPGATAGMLADADREALASGLATNRDLPSEVVEFAGALSSAEGDLLCHDGLL